MRIILTHEQADFDAVASLLGAHLLDDSAVPVLPRRMNRNVSAFINVYGVDLPFVDPRDLPGENIDMVTLVDTQSITSIKGMGADTKVQVVDHHPMREDLPDAWQVTSEDVGATSTLFVEGLRERNGSLGTVSSTLMLLGIYEDTGSLTYTRTTPRDVQAVAYLLEQGARLDIAADFLNHPLSSQQQALYDELRRTAETINVHGYNIVVACGDAQNMDEELSTIAHKLRDLLDPDALFVLVTTRSGVQLIARSTSDNIDVAQIADRFGGGGHERAAAGLIKDKDIIRVREQLLEVLLEYIKPSITVAQIMSHSPQLLSPDTPVEEAAQRMQRFGYEGYPVVDKGKVIGLLTRRAVDRALAHELNYTASNLMNAGSHSVYPGDSIEHLQRLMTETGWGQIPVVQPETGRIVGIVTRTDLLKTLTRDHKLPRPHNLSDRLESAIPPAHLLLLKSIARMAHQQRSALYIVGGFVRDLLLERPSLDFDLVVEGDAIALVRSLARHYGGRVTSHARFGTAKWHINGFRENLLAVLSKEHELHTDNNDGQIGDRLLKATDLPDSIDLITARTEFYTHPTALPTVERGSIKLDLHRRDFTINTLALRLDGRYYGELQDYWGGLNDVQRGWVRVLHSLSFVDDPTRMLRAIRFEQRFGFKIEGRTMHLLQEARQLLDRVSGDRIRHELDHILAEEKACAMLARLSELGLLSSIHKDLTWDEWLITKMQDILTMDFDPVWELGGETLLDEHQRQLVKRRLIYIVWLIRLSEKGARSVIERLKISRNLADEILAARRLWQELPSLKNAPPSRIFSRLNDVPSAAVYAAFLACDDDELRGLLYEFVSRWKHVTPTIDGHHLSARGLPPGPIYRKILETLRNAWLDGEISSVEEEKKLLETLIREHGSDVNKGYKSE